MSQTFAQLINGKSATVEFSTGSASTPSVAFSGDTNTGIYSPGADQVAISTNGTRRFQASSDGTINVFGANKTPSGGGNSVVYATDTQAVDVGGSIAFGGYYIGTSSDTEWAQIAGRKENSTSGNYAGYLQFSTRANGGSTTERLRITSAGLVGIGTTSPGNLLTVSTNTDGTTSLLKLHADADGVNNGLAGIKLSGNAGDHAAYIYGGHSTSGNTFLSFYTDLYAGSHNPQEKMRLDANGRLLVGTSTANGNYTLQIQGDAAASTSYGSIYLRRGLNTASIGANVGAGLGQIVFGANDGTTAALIECTSDAAWSSTSDTPGRLVFSTTADGASSPTERMRIRADGQIQVTNNNTNIIFVNTGVNGTALCYFQTASAELGKIRINGAGVAYDTTSDYRLKENLQPITDATSRLLTLKPWRFNFISHPDVTVDGFLAHEAQEVVPEAVGGSKDEVNDDGNPVYQGIDQSKLVPLLTAALQEAIGEIESLKARVAALESA